MDDRLQDLHRPYILEQAGDKELIDLNLSRHACLNYAHAQTRHGWDLYAEGGIRNHAEVNNTMTCNTVEALIQAARAGLGISLAPECLVREDLERGSLVRVLPQFTLLEIGFQLVYPSRKYLPAKVRSVIDYLLAEVA